MTKSSLVRMLLGRLSKHRQQHRPRPPHPLKAFSTIKPRQRNAVTPNPKHHRESDLRNLINLRSESPSLPLCIGSWKFYMEGEDSILDSIYDDNFEDGEDVEMLDVEEGELVEHEAQNGSVQGSGGNDSGANQEHQNKGSKNKRKKRRNRKKNSGGPRTNAFDLDRFVSDTCRNLREHKSYLVYTAVACLGVSALRDLIKEVNAIQACGGQMTANGKRLRTGGGLLWNIIKAREPKAYKEIMKKAREFEKQFKRPYSIQPPTNQSKVEPSQVFATSSEDGTPAKFSNDLQLVSEMTEIPEMQTQDNQSNPQSKHVSVHDRLRIPVSYDDDLLAGEPKDDAI